MRARKVVTKNHDVSVSSYLATIGLLCLFGLSTSALQAIETTSGLMNVNNYLGADRFYNAGITGQNAIVANVEGGHIWNGHETLTNVTTFVTGTGASGDFDDHATAVGMLIAGRKGGPVQGDWQTGIAYGADLRSGAIAGYWVQYGTEYSGRFYTSSETVGTTYGAFFGTADVINSSWGGTDTTGTDPLTTLLDAFARNNRTTTFVASAGNSGLAGANTVGGPASGYNCISVGALSNPEPFVHIGDSYNTIANYSSRGPQDYYDPVTRTTIPGVRAVVDIVAPGDSMQSAYYGGATGGNTWGAPVSGSNLYTTYVAGTSASAPIVAGGATLLDSASHVMGLGDNSRDGRVIKAVLMNSADKIAGWNNGQSLINNVVTTTQSLDWNLGAGRMDLNTAYDQYLSGTEDVSGLAGGSIGKIGWDYGQLNSVGNHNDYVFNTDLLGGTMLDVTLTWYRHTAFNTYTYASGELSLANFDLEVWDSTFTTLIATSDSLYNGSEELHFALPSTGEYGLRVKYTSNLFGTAVAEDYGLAWSDTTVVPEPGQLAMLLGAAAAWFAWRRRRWQKSGD